MSIFDTDDPYRYNETEDVENPDLRNLSFSDVPKNRNYTIEVTAVSIIGNTTSTRLLRSKGTSAPTLVIMLFCM